MLTKIRLNKGQATDLRPHKGKSNVLRRLVLEGRGTLDSCMLTFFKDGDNQALGKDVLFLKPLHEKAQVLTPHERSFTIAAYDFCALEIFTGTIMDDDAIILYLLSEKQANI